jgi:hypothetical protein
MKRKKKSFSATSHKQRQQNSKKEISYDESKHVVVIVIDDTLFQSLHFGRVISNIDSELIVRKSMPIRFKGCDRLKKCQSRFIVHKKRSLISAVNIYKRLQQIKMIH